MEILAFDPGKKNFAFATLIDGRLTGYGHVPTITTLRPEDYHQGVDRFITAVIPLLDRRPTILTFERMQSRPGFGAGAVVEYINLMIGMILAEAHRRAIKVFPVAPVTWKSHWIKVYGVEKKRFTMVTQKLSIKQPKGSKTKTKAELVRGLLDRQDITPHEGDAIGLAAYCWYRETGVDVLPSLMAK